MKKCEYIDGLSLTELQAGKRPHKKIEEIEKELHKPIEVKVPDLISIDSKGKVETIFSRIWKKLKW